MSLTPSLPRTPENVRDAKRTKAARLAQNSLTAYKRLIYRHYQHADHLEKLDRALEQVSRYAETGGAEGVGRLIVEMPPRHGKTLTVSRMYPTWHLGRNPDHRVMLVSYGSSLARKNSRYARAVIRTNKFQSVFGPKFVVDGDIKYWDVDGIVTLDPASAAAEEWNLGAPYEGGCDAMGLGGAATGKGAHVLVIDDPVKNREDAESETMRNKAWDGYADDLYTRLEPGGAIVVMMTRWHQDDLIGRLLKNDLEGWTRLRLPAFAEADDPLGRAEGAALWPWRYPAEVLDKTRRTLGPYSWSALYQQAPTPAEGGIFKRAWFDPLHTFTPSIQYAVRFWDLAMSEKTSADYTAGVKLGVGHDGHYYVLDVARRQVEWGDLAEWMAQVMLTDGPEVTQGIEEKGYMTRAIDDLNADPRLHNYAVFGHPVDKDKLTRALPFAARCAAGQVHVLEGHWTRDYLDELCSFPQGMHDDQVDASSGAWAMVGGEGALQVGALSMAANPRAIA